MCLKERRIYLKDIYNLWQAAVNNIYKCVLGKGNNRRIDIRRRGGE
jgi:hypothetical protein